MSKFFNKISNSDSLKFLKKIPDKTFDLIFADLIMQIGKELKDPIIAVNGVNENGMGFQTLIITIIFLNLAERV